MRVTVRDPRVDVSVSRVLALLEKTELERRQNEEGGGTGGDGARRAPVDEDTDEEEEEEEAEAIVDEEGGRLERDESVDLDQTGGQSVSRIHDNDNRLRRRTPPDSSSASSLPPSSAGAGPSHTRRANRSRHTRPRKRLRSGEPSNAPLPSDSTYTHPSDGYGHRRHFRCSREEERAERFQKDLVESLTCEICFMLLYQPVTTPCQHV